MTSELCAIYEKLWNQRRPDTEIVCSLVENATVEGPGLVFDRDLRLVRQTIHQAGQEEIETAYASVLHHAEKGLLHSEPGVTLLCEKAGIGNYGHWLVEMLPIAYLNRARLIEREWRVRLPVASAPMNAVVTESIALLGIPGEQARFRPGGPQRYEQLVVVRGVAQHGIWYSPRVVEALETLASQVPASAAADIWFSRLGSSRQLTAEEETNARLRDLGWTILHPERLSLRQQIAAAKGARRIAGVSGAALTNLAFAPRKSRVTAFMPASMPDVFFWMLAGFKEHAFREVRCRQADAGTASIAWNAQLEMSPDEVIGELM